MSDEKVKRVARKSTKVPITEPKSLPPIDVMESMKVVLETLEYAKPKTLDGESVDVTTGHKFL